ncbi:MAG TPA: hypothetical protein VHZ55_15200 [Bryobacteraceae bacterium]|jgi:hypothetical protein|nr:hypothetical protein [Bryobacteraceae bacterium]
MRAAAAKEAPGERNWTSFHAPLKPALVNRRFAEKSASQYWKTVRQLDLKPADYRFHGFSKMLDLVLAD